MRNSLMVKLVGAFLLVIAVGALVIWWLASQAAQSAYNLYTTRSGQLWAQQIAPQLADYYASQGSWQGIDALFNDQLSGAAQGTGQRMGNGYRPGLGAGLSQGQSVTGAGVGSMMNPRFILADAQGSVISDTGGDLAGKTLPASELAKGAAITLGSNTIGTIIVAPASSSSQATLANQFLASINTSILTAVLIAGAIALVLGTLLFFQITAPLRQLKKAAFAIARGDLTQRVAIHSHDELRDVGLSFNLMAESLSRAETLRRHMVADVAHELRTPIAVIRANIEGMQDGVLPYDSDQLAAMHAQTMLLSRLVADLRLLSLAEAGELKLEREATDLGALIGRLVEQMKPQASQKGITLEAQLAPGLPAVSIDADRITQVLNNLIDNAMRYTPAGGKITVAASPFPTGGGVQVSVTDTGAGIDPEDLPYVLDRFYRAEKSRSRPDGGSGLGLAIVKQLVEAHGGKVEVISPAFQDSAHLQGFGTAIKFDLPVAVNQR
jgi:signal transduction histidine kinase